MAITKEEIAHKIEVLESGNVQVRTATVIKEDGTELTRSFHRHTLAPSDKSSGSWADTDISSEKTNLVKRQIYFYTIIKSNYIYIPSSPARHVHVRI